MLMKEIEIIVVLSVTLLAVAGSSPEGTKSESQSSRERRDYFKPHQHHGKLARFSDTEITLVTPPQLVHKPSEARRKANQQRSLHGYLQLMPVTNPRADFEPRNPKWSWAQERIMNGYKTLPDNRPKVVAKSPEEMNIGERLARWFFSAVDVDDSEEAGTAPRGSVARPPPNYQPPNYESYPPFWQDDGSSSKSYPPAPPKHHPPPRPRGPPRHHVKPYKQSKPDCNPCNSVPWIPISKAPAGSGISTSYGVPTVDVHHDTTGYSSSHQAAVVPPAPVVEHIPDTTISGSYGLPAGNVPTGHGLLAPVNHLAALPSSYGSPEIQHHGFVQQVPVQPIPFPELSPVPIVPLHGSNQFANPKPETEDLVPPVPPKSVSNVVFTISEQPGPGDNHLEEHQAASQQSATVVEGDQHSQPSSLIDTRATPKFQDLNRYTNRYQNHNHGGGLDIVKSVPLAEYTSSIEYPLHIIQSGPYIDINASNNNHNYNYNASSGSVTYEKESQTGSQKVSDILLGSTKDSESKKSATDSDASGSIHLEHSANDVEKETTKYYDGPTTTIGLQETTTNPTTTIEDHSGTYSKGSSPYYVEVQPTAAQPQLHAFQNSFHQEHGHLIMNPVGQSPSTVYNKDYLDPNILTPPPLPPSLTQLLPIHEAPHFDHSPKPYLNPPRFGTQNRPTKETPLGLMANPSSTTWLLPAQSDNNPHWLLPASNTPAVAYPFNVDNPGIASVINGGLLPPPPPQPLNTNAPKPKTKKIQIIIPYTTIKTKNHDQKTVDTVHNGVYQKPATENYTLPEKEKANTWMPIVVTEQTPQNQGRKVPKRYQNFENFKSVGWSEGQHSETKTISANVSDSKLFGDVQQILSGNIKELLKDELEKPKSEQNLRLQKNIDNWTALEYSNHKVVSKKEPQDVISHAQAVTSIPGTSISHLLLPSKKIPTTYLTTTPIPKYDEPRTTPFATSSVSVESKPFTSTGTYTTASMYSTVARNGFFTTTPKPTSTDSEKRNVFKINISKLEQIKQQNIRNSQLSSFANQQNHRNGYKDIVKTSSSLWEKLKENLVVPEPVSGNRQSESPEVTTSGTTWFDHKISISPVTNEKVYVVTPVSNWETTSTARDVYRRTTRHITTTTEKLTPTTSKPDLDTKSSTYPKTVKFTKTPRVPFTKLEKLGNGTKTNSTKDYVRIKVFNKNDSTPLFRLKNETSFRVKISKFNKPKPVDKFFATTTAPLKTATAVNESSNSTRSNSTTGIRTEDGKPSINDIFPFRNGGELPLEMTKTNLNAGQIEFKNAGTRKTLIRQVKINKKAKESRKVLKVPIEETAETTTEYRDWTTTEDLPETSTVLDNSVEGTNLQVDVLLPHNDTKQEIPKKKATVAEGKKKFVGKFKSTTPKPSNSTSKFNPEEPNITDDERQEINNLPAKKPEEETLLAVESNLPKGVFGETSKVGVEANATWPFKSDTIQETIQLLKEFLRDSADDDKSEGLKVNENFKEHEKLLDGLESLKPMLNRTVEGSQSEAKANVKDNLKSIESKLLKKLNKQGKDMYVYNFPEYLVDDLRLNKDELGLVEGAMVELRKSKQKKTSEA